MSTSSYDSVFNVQAGRITIPVGATVAVLFAGDTVKGCNSTILKYVSGGTLEIIGMTTQIVGQTLTAAQLATLSGTGYLVGGTEVLQFSGPVQFYLSATGATTVVTFLRGLTQEEVLV